MSIQFLAARPGLIYRVETTTGVTQPAPGPDGKVTASVARDGPKRFMRLVVQ